MKKEIFLLPSLQLRRDILVNGDSASGEKPARTMHREEAMKPSDQLQVQYDFRSGSVLLQCKNRSHVLREKFRTKESAEAAAVEFARENWDYPVTTAMPLAAH